GNAVVLRGSIELPKEQILRAVAVVIGSRQHELHAVGELFANRRAAGIAVETAVGGRGFHAVDLFALARNDIDNAEKGVVAVEHRARAANDFHAVDQVEIQDESGVDERAVVQVVIDAMAVHQEQNAAVEIAEVHAARAEKLIVAVVGNVKALDTFEQIAERPPAVTLDLIGGDDGGGGWGFGGFLCELRRAEHHRDVHQVGDVQIGEIRSLVRAGIGARAQAQQEKAAKQPEQKRWNARKSQKKGSFVHVSGPGFYSIIVGTFMGCTATRRRLDPARQLPKISLNCHQ